MLFQQLNRSDAEKVYVICKNVSGATASAHYPVFYDTAHTQGNDGHAISGARTNQKFMFAGIPEAAIADGAHGLVQVYGKGSAYVLVTAALAAGDQVIAADSTVHLVNFTPGSASSGCPVNNIANPWNFVTAMSAMASGISTAVKEPVFIRAL
jgi:hypothetical protein